ncbi:MAG: adenylyltransferase/cytidyltransferase family protein, partial [Terriglobales bacterium]
MNIGFFGGTFDPIHHGHLALAQAAANRYSLRQVLFVPANVPPHKQKHPLTAFIHRYAMVALATLDEKGFVPSLLEAPESTTNHVGSVASGASPERSRKGPAQQSAAEVNYSIDTI